MKRLLIWGACMTAIAALLGACTEGMDRLNADYGTSYKLAKVNQTLDPDAEKNLTPVYDMNGVAARNAMEKYYKGFQEPKTAQPIYTIPIGNAATGQ